MKKYLATASIILTSAFLPLCAGAQGTLTLINPTTLNGSFEDNSSKTDFSSGLVPSWVFWTSAAAMPSETDSGNDVSGAATQGTRDAFFEGGTAAYDLTTYTVAAGDSFTYTWDWALQGRGAADVELGYWNGSNFIGIDSTETSAQSNTGNVLDITYTYTAALGDAAIGSDIGIGVIVPAGSNYPEVDNFVLSVQAVPEPSVMTLVGLGVFGIFFSLKRKYASC